MKTAGEGLSPSGPSAARDLAALILVNALWGATDVAAKSALAVFAPAVVAWVRFSLALVVLGPVLVRRRAELPRSLSGLAPYAALGACGFFLNFILNYHGIALSSPSHATALRVSEVLVIAGLSALILRERVGRRALAGLGLGAVGAVLIMDLDWRHLALFGEGARLGDLLIVAGIVVEGLYTVIGKRVLRNARPLTATALACVFGWAMLSVWSVPDLIDLARQPRVPAGLAKALAGCVYLGLVGTAFGYVVWYRVLSRRPSHRVGVTIMVQPVVGVPLAALWWGDRLSPEFIAGALLVALGVYLAAGASSDGSGSSAPVPG